MLSKKVLTIELAGETYFIVENSPAQPTRCAGRVSRQTAGYSTQNLLHANDWFRLRYPQRGPWLIGVAFLTILECPTGDIDTVSLGTSNSKLRSKSSILGGLQRSRTMCHMHRGRCHVVLYLAQRHDDPYHRL